MKRRTENFVRFPATILIDRREKLPYRFEGLFSNKDQGSLPIIVETQRTTLNTGDYCLAEFSSEFVIERKTFPDLVNCLTNARSRFSDCVKRMSRMPLSAVVVEADWNYVFQTHDGDVQWDCQEFNPKVISRSIFSYIVRYPTVHWLLFPNRNIAEQATFRLFEKFLTNRQGAGHAATTMEGDRK